MNCAHEGCNCKETAIRNGEKGYCSEACATADQGGGGGEKTGCPCGHADCGK